MALKTYRKSSSFKNIHIYIYTSLERVCRYTDTHGWELIETKMKGKQEIAAVMQCDGLAPRSKTVI